MKFDSKNILVLFDVTAMLKIAAKKNLTGPTWGCVWRHRR
jgi:hypothetical protein